MTDTSKLANELVSLMQEMPSYAQYDSGQLDAFVSAYCDAGQAIVGRAQKGDGDETVFGFGFWARISGTMAQKLRAQDFDPITTPLDQIEAGDEPWVIELVAKSDVVETFLKTVGESVFPGESFHVRTKTKDGEVAIIKANRV